MGSDRALGVALASALLLLLAAPARAQDDDARARAARLFREAAADYEAGKTSDAAVKFEESHRLVPRAAAIYSAARAWDASGAVDRAADDYESALERTDLHGAEAEDARKRLSEIGPRVGVVAVVAPDDAHVWIGHVEGALGSVRVHLVPGDYDARVERSGYQPWRSHLHLDGGQAVRLEATLLAAAAVAVIPPARPIAREEPRAAEHRDRTWGWVALGVAAGAAILSAVFYAETVQARDRFDASGDRDAHLQDVAVGWRTATYVGYGVTGAAGATGATLFVW